jgi:hypothetical protein
MDGMIDPAALRRRPSAPAARAPLELAAERLERLRETGGYPIPNFPNAADPPRASRRTNVSRAMPSAMVKPLRRG